MGANGCILSQGSLSKALAKDKKLSAGMKQETKQIAKAGHEIDSVEATEESKKSDGKLIVAEEISEGHVGWPARAYRCPLPHSILADLDESVKMWFGAVGGDRAVMFWMLFASFMIITPVIEIGLTWYLGYWANQYEDHDPSEISAP